MSQQEKGEYFRKLKAAGVDFSKHYRDYTTEELRTAWQAYEAEQAKHPAPPDPLEGEESDPDAMAFYGQAAPEPQPATTAQARMPEPTTAEVALAAKDPHEMAGQRQNSNVELEPIRTDEEGRIWFQEEVLKPAFPKPRGRRVLQYMEGGVETRTVKNGEFVETFEVAGVKNRRPAEIKITLPSYQVGIYKDRRFPFKIHTYNGNQGFDLFEVQNYYGGAELVPETVKKIYVENVLCYDIRTVVRAIQSEFRQLQLQGKV